MQRDKNTNDHINQLAATANKYHEETRHHIRWALEKAKRAGEALIEAKSHVEHGQWSTWLKDNFDGSTETARIYMRVAKHWDEHLKVAVEREPSVSLSDALNILRTYRSSQMDQTRNPIPKPETDTVRCIKAQRNIVNKFGKLLPQLLDTETLVEWDYNHIELDAVPFELPDGRKVFVMLRRSKSEHEQPDFEHIKQEVAKIIERRLELPNQ